MSIDKIKERMRMIEENDFSINELHNNLSAHQINTLSNMGSKDRTTMLKNVNKNDINKEKVRDLANNHFANSSTYNISDEENVELSVLHEYTVFNIYRILKTNNVLTPEIDSTTLMPKIGYVKYAQRYSSIKNSVKTLRNGDVQFIFDDERQSRLEEMVMYFNKGTNFNDIKDAKSEIDYSATTLDIDNINLTNTNRGWRLTLIFR